MPRHPATRAALEDVLGAEATLDVEALIDAAVEASDYEYIKSDWEQQVQGEGSADPLLAAGGLPDVSAESR